MADVNAKYPVVNSAYELIFEIDLPTPADSCKVIVERMVWGKVAFSSNQSFRLTSIALGAPTGSVQKYSINLWDKGLILGDKNLRFKVWIILKDATNAEIGKWVEADTKAIKPKLDHKKIALWILAGVAAIAVCVASGWGIKGCRDRQAVVVDDSKKEVAADNSGTSTNPPSAIPGVTITPKEPKPATEPKAEAKEEPKEPPQTETKVVVAKKEASRDAVSTHPIQVPNGNGNFIFPINGNSNVVRVRVINNINNYERPTSTQGAKVAPVDLPILPPQASIKSPCWPFDNSKSEIGSLLTPEQLKDRSVLVRRVVVEVPPGADHCYRYPKGWLVKVETDYTDLLTAYDIRDDDVDEEYPKWVRMADFHGEPIRSARVKSNAKTVKRVIFILSREPV